MPRVNVERHREQAITMLARGLASGFSPNENDFRAAAGIVDAITTHTIETYRAVIRAERAREFDFRRIEIDAEDATAVRFQELDRELTE